MAPACQQPVDAAARKQHHQEKDRTEDQLPVLLGCRYLLAGDEDGFGGADEVRQDLLQHQQGHGAHYRAEHGAHATEHRHDNGVPERVQCMTPG